MTEDFTAVRFRSLGWIPPLLTAAVYSVIHFARWLPAIGAGTLFYRIFPIRGQRKAEATTAYVTASLLLVGTGLPGHQWQLR